MEREKNILYVITKGNWGGAQKYVYDLATSLPKDRFDVVVAYGGTGLLSQRLQAASIKTVHVKGLQRNFNPLKELLSFFHLIWIFLREKPDVIHLNSSKIGALGAVAAFFYKLLTFNFKPLTIFTVHGWGFKEDRPLWSRGIIFLISWATSLFQDKIILINQADLKSAQKFIPDKKIRLIYNGIRQPDFLPLKQCRAALSQNTGIALGTQPLIVGTIAELTANKGILYLLEAVHKLGKNDHRTEIKTVIIGEGAQKKIIEDKIRALALKNTVFLTGFLPEAERLIPAFDVFVLPSLKEGLPYTILEAMSGECPVIASRVGGIPDVIEHGKNGVLVPPKNPAELAQALSDLIQDKNKRTLLAQKAKTTVANLFSLKEMVEKTATLYEEKRD